MSLGGPEDDRGGTEHVQVQATRSLLSEVSGGRDRSDEVRSDPEESEEVVRTVWETTALSWRKRRTEGDTCETTMSS